MSIFALRASKRTIKRIFQIAYDEQEGLRSAELLRGLGYGVISVLGNEAAKVLLRSIQAYDLFIVGDAAPEERRREMLDWLRANYRRILILALNPAHRLLPNADYNDAQCDPAVWLPFVTEQTGKSASAR